MANAETLLTEHLDLWSSTVKAKNSVGRGSSKKRELYGIKKLRELILELAVQGLLVPQDPKDEPASKLLKRIEEEKARLIEEKKIKNPRKAAPIKTTLDSPNLPRGWEQENLGKLAFVITDGTHHTPKYLEKGVEFISVKDIDGKTVSFKDCKYLSKEHTNWE